MALLPFTPEGVQQKQVELYSLPDNELLLQAQAISADLRSWVEDNFDLSPAQKEYYSKVPDTINFAWGAQISAAVINRGEITMAPLPEYTTTDRTKEIKVKDEGETDYTPENSLTGKGTAHRVAIEWQLL